MESVKKILNDLHSKCEEAFKALEHDFSGLRTGRATPALLEPLEIEVYGGRMPLSQLGTISAPQSNLLTVQAWDTGVVASIEKGLRKASFNPVVEGALIRVPIAALTNERRQELKKMAHQYAEKTRIGLRGLRRHAIDELEKVEKAESLSEDTVHSSKNDIQKKIDDFIKKVDETLAQREKMILQI